MYQLILSQSEYLKFKREAKAEMVKQDLSVKDLAERTGYPISTIYNFFSKQNSKFVAYAIQKELGMEKK